MSVPCGATFFLRTTTLPTRTAWIQEQSSSSRHTRRARRMGTSFPCLCARSRRYSIVSPMTNYFGYPALLIIRLGVFFFVEIAHAIIDLLIQVAQNPMVTASPSTPSSPHPSRLTHPPVQTVQPPPIPYKADQLMRLKIAMRETEHPPNKRRSYPFQGYPDVGRNEGTIRFMFTPPEPSSRTSERFEPFLDFLNVPSPRPPWFSWWLWYTVHFCCCFVQSTCVMFSHCWSLAFHFLQSARSPYHDATTRTKEPTIAAPI